MKLLYISEFAKFGFFVFKFIDGDGVPPIAVVKC